MKSFIPAEDQARRLLAVALGGEDADLAVVNARMVNVYTGEILDGSQIAVSEKWIAYVGRDASASIGPRTQVLDAGGKIVIPGLIEGHTHLVWLASVSEYLRYLVPGGTTTVISETLEAYPVAGVEGVVDVLASFADQPIKLFGTAPAMVSVSRATAGIADRDLALLVSREDVLGLGESYWQALMQQPDSLLPAYAAVRGQRKTLEGHSAGASEKKLNAYVAAGISSCHEPISAPDVLDRIRLGLHVMIREGSIRRDLAAISKITGTGVDTRRLILSTDGVAPDDLIARGGLDHVLQKAIDCGFDPVAAVQMATLNVAEHFGIDGMTGGIAPGRCADMLVLPDLGTIDPQWVISNGRVVAEGGHMLVAPRVHAYSAQSRTTVHLDAAMDPGRFAIPAPGHPSTASVRVIDMVSDLVTRAAAFDMPVVDGRIPCDPARDILKAAAIDRTRRPGRTFTGLIHGFGLARGALAASSAWDTCDIIVVGTDDTDMALAVNRISDMQGGAVLCDGGRVVQEIPMPVLGVISDLPMETLAGRLADLKAAVRERGCPFPDPLLSLIALTGAAIPFFRICEEGLVDLKTGRTAGCLSDPASVDSG
ncbi:adenine deaminase [Desulfosarcina alkanivorans]|uniref:adenine deaminase n=1 Tax=Desulfosarcina alkanivorans TaxID=571177 RepID=A0A5K7YCS4_9BACT|nr:adenine deaminase C-terminal domain-containing protein [Desulfosarcina alkanivorans]BBO66215.1 adenine deaminase [Desulfosarcina alkanivorans]